MFRLVIMILDVLIGIAYTMKTRRFSWLGNIHHTTMVRLLKVYPQRHAERDNFTDRRKDTKGVSALPGAVPLGREKKRAVSERGTHLRNRA